MVAGIRKATDLIEASTSSKSGIESPMETRNKKKQRSKTSQKMEQVEYDEIFVKESNVQSVQ